MGGSIADRFNKRNILIAISIVNALFAFVLFALYSLGTLTYSVLAFVALLLGTVNAIEGPLQDY
jgi:nitrate/nitrite transporter NarK